MIVHISVHTAPEDAESISQNDGERGAMNVIVGPLTQDVAAPEKRIITAETAKKNYVTGTENTRNEYSADAERHCSICS